MPVYDFTFPAGQAGKTVVVRNSRGTVVASGPLGLTPSGNSCVFSAALAADDYTCAPAENIPDVDDVPGSIAAGGGTPTADTAFLVATVPTAATDGAAHVLTLVWDSRFPQVDWLTIDAGEATIPDGAGSCTVGLITGGDVDFSGTTAPDDPGTFGGNGKMFINDVFAVGASFNDSGDILGDGQDVQSLGVAGPAFSADPIDFAPGDVVTVKATVYAYADVDQEVPIDDGVATVTIAVAITRGGSAPTLP